MTPMCSEHAALLRACARNTNDKTVQKAYADWLQERGNPGWLIVANYPIQDWFFYQNRPHKLGVYRLLWLDGYAPYEAFTQRELQHHLVRIKKLLSLYTDDKVSHEAL